VFRDLGNPQAALAWNTQAAMPEASFARSVGMRLAIVACAALATRDLEQGLALANRSVDLLARVHSARARDYLHQVSTALATWRAEPAVREFLHRTRTELRPV
jgi:hypothetical protein